MIEKCVIHLDKKDHFPGDQLDGSVEIHFKTGKRVKAITVILHGEGILKLESDSRIEPIIEEYIHEEVEILRSKKYNHAEREIVLVTSGAHRYKFSFNLPSNLPSTFSLKKANISYRLTAEVDIQGYLEPLYDSKTVHIDGYVDLNGLVPLSLRGPHRKTAVNDIFCVCFQMDPLSLKVEIPYGGYVPLQTIDVNCFVRNKSLLNKTKSYRKERNLQKLSVPNSAVRRGMQKVFKVPLQIPDSTEVPSLTNCRILRTHCELIVKAVLPYPHFDLIVCIPFYLGTVPLQNTPLPLPEE
ncbi:hypothetical protein RN001_010779 [Aquatica leii]|uniref:Arrestin C-terminal-like domain-containing protein n=1 Tax=Aquatica leii TaxID=1421715 RepID=A0AAN7P8A2_9COLE|nr:hypothetical protein RN001_010779 [Aquatica leii]